MKPPDVYLIKIVAIIAFAAGIVTVAFAVLQPHERTAAWYEEHGEARAATIRACLKLPDPQHDDNCLRAAGDMETARFFFAKRTF